MQGHFKVKTKLSWSPSKNKEAVYVVKARLGKKLPSLTPAQFLDRIGEHRRSTSHSAAKNRNSSSKLFKNAHIIDSKETYLINDNKSKENRTNGSSSPNSPHEIFSSVPKFMVASDKIRNRSNSGLKESSKRKTNKDIQRTVAFAYKGQTQNVPVETQLMTTLSRLILGDEKCQDDFYLEILGESSIHGDEENFIDLGQTDIFGEAGPGGIQKQLTI